MRDAFVSFMSEDVHLPEDVRSQVGTPSPHPSLRLITSRNSSVFTGLASLSHHNVSSVQGGFVCHICCCALQTSNCAWHITLDSSYAKCLHQDS